MTKTELLATVIDAVKLYSVSDAEIRAESHLLDDKIIDSMNMLQIVLELEKQLGIRIGAIDITFDDFRTAGQLADAIASLMQRK